MTTPHRSTLRSGTPGSGTLLARRPADLISDIEPGDRWLVVVAHPDDESFGCGSLIAHAAARGAHVAIVCATRGEAGNPTDLIPEGVALGPLREFELLTAAYLLGTTDVVLLDHRDSDFEGPLHPAALCAVPVADLANELRTHLDRVHPHVVLVLDGSDGHRDHLHVRAATIAAFDDVTAADGTGSGETADDDATAGDGTGGAALYEHCLPNALMRRWLDEMRSVGPDTTYHQIDPACLGRPDADVTHVVDVRAVRARRDAAMAMHRSQTSPFEHLSRELRDAFLDTDHVALVRSRG